jgi:hypothetical protein
VPSEPIFDRAFVAARAAVDGAERPCVVAVRDGRIAAVLDLDPTHPAQPVAAREIVMPLNSIPSTTTVAALARKRERAATQARVDVGFWGGAVPGNAAEFEALHAAGVFGFKCFLVDSGVPEFPPLDSAGLAAAMAETARLGALLIVHAEDAELIAAAPAPGGRSYAATCAHARRSRRSGQSNVSSPRPASGPLAPACTCCSCRAPARSRSYVPLAPLGSTCRSKPVRNTSRSSPRRSTRRDAVQVRAADPRCRQLRAAVDGSGGRRDRHDRVRSLPVPRGPQAP